MGSPGFKLDHFSIETNGFGVRPFKETSRSLEIGKLDDFPSDWPSPESQHRSIHRLTLVSRLANAFVQLCQI